MARSAMRGRRRRGRSRELACRGRVFESPMSIFGRRGKSDGRGVVPRYVRRVYSHWWRHAVAEGDSGTSASVSESGLLRSPVRIPQIPFLDLEEMRTAVQL